MNNSRRCFLFTAMLLSLWTPAIARADIIDDAERGDLSAVKADIAAHADVNAKNKDGQTALMCAAIVGCTACVRVLVAARADVNAKDNYGRTALIDAACRGSLDCVRALTAAHANVKAKNNDGITALMWAQGHPDIVAALKAAGAK